MHILVPVHHAPSSGWISQVSNPALIMVVLCVWWQRVSSPAQQQTPCAATAMGAINQPELLQSQPQQQQGHTHSVKGVSSAPKHKQLGRLKVEQSAARAASWEPDTLPTLVHCTVSPRVIQSRAAKRKHGCASCCWCAAGCEQCRADYGRGLAVSPASGVVIACVPSCCRPELMCAHAASIRKVSLWVYRLIQHFVPFTAMLSAALEATQAVASMPVSGPFSRVHSTCECGPWPQSICYYWLRGAMDELAWAM